MNAKAVKLMRKLEKRFKMTDHGKAAVRGIYDAASSTKRRDMKTELQRILKKAPVITK